MRRWCLRLRILRTIRLMKVGEINLNWQIDSGGKYRKSEEVISLDFLRGGRPANEDLRAVVRSRELVENVILRLGISVRFLCFMINSPLLRANCYANKSTWSLVFSASSLHCISSSAIWSKARHIIIFTANHEFTSSSYFRLTNRLIICAQVPMSFFASSLSMWIHHSQLIFDRSSTICATTLHNHRLPLLRLITPPLFHSFIHFIMEQEERKKKTERKEGRKKGRKKGSGRC